MASLHRGCADYGASLYAIIGQPVCDIQMFAKKTPPDDVLQCSALMIERKAESDCCFSHCSAQSRKVVVRAPQRFLGGKIIFSPSYCGRLSNKPTSLRPPQEKIKLQSFIQRFTQTHDHTDVVHEVQKLLRLCFAFACTHVCVRRTCCLRSKNMISSLSKN